MTQFHPFQDQNPSGQENPIDESQFVEKMRALPFSSQAQKENFERFLKLSPIKQSQLLENVESRGCNLSNCTIFTMGLMIFLSMVVGFGVVGYCYSIKMCITFAMAVFLMILLDSINCLCIKKWFPKTNQKTVRLYVSLIFGSINLCLLVLLILEYSSYLFEEFYFWEAILESMVSFGLGLALSWGLFPNLEELFQKIFVE